MQFPGLQHTAGEAALGFWHGGRGDGLGPACGRGSGEEVVWGGGRPVRDVRGRLRLVPWRPRRKESTVPPVPQAAARSAGVGACGDTGHQTILPALESFGGPMAGTCRASRPGKRPDRPRRTCVLSATAAFTRAGTPPGSVPDGARPEWRAQDRLGDEDPEVLERLARRVAGVTHGADRILTLGAG